VSIQYLATCAVRKRSRHYIYKPVKRTVSISLVIGSGTRGIIALTHFSKLNTNRLQRVSSRKPVFRLSSTYENPQMDWPLQEWPSAPEHCDLITNWNI
jgi:hypothetical protein